MSEAARALGRWLCEACGLVYDEARGDPDSGLAPGTRFEDVPEDWRCPVCGVTKADFRPIAPRPAAGAARAPAAAPRTARPAGDGVVIVGSGTAGWAVARALREGGWSGAITVVTACDGTAYPKPWLSVALARGLDADALVEQRGPELAAELGVRLLARAWALELDVAYRRLVTTRGTLRASHVVLATGARARRPVFPGAGAARLLAVNDLSAYARLREAFETSRVRAAAEGRAPRLAIVGAGLVGCELADDFAGAGAEVTLIEARALPLAERLDADTGTRLRDALVARGVRFSGGASVREAMVPQGALADDAQIGLVWDARGASHAGRFDLALVAAGIEPELRLARRAGLPVARGVVVDAHTLSCADGRVFALGDCAEVDGRLGCTVEPIGRQARTIAGAIVGRPEPYVARDPVWVVKTPSLPLTIRPVPADARPA
jgi:rubredoxin-NAD+ reductase